jgi:predicted hydrocarbon binding protein
MVKKLEDEKKEGIISVAKNQISEFFHHLIAYGGFDLRDGVITYWGDYSVFVPMESFVTIYYELKKDIGEEQTNELFYWLGTLIGRNSTNLLLKKYGLDKSNLPLFVNGATQDGLGYLKILKYDKEFNKGKVSGTNSIFALSYKKIYGNAKDPVDYYLAGMLAGGTEPLVNKFVEAIEITCMARGDQSCLYELKPLKEKKKYLFFEGMSFDEEEIIKSTLSLILRRKASFKPFGKKEIVFGDGSFQLRGVTGINFMTYGMIYLDRILYEKLGKKKDKYDSILVDCAVKSILDKIKKKNLPDILKEIEIFGLGKFNIKMAGTKSLS